MNTTFFPYSWHLDPDETEITAFRIYGLNQKNKNVCVRIDDFTPFIYVQLPDVPGGWTDGKAQTLCSKIDEMLGELKPLKKSLERKKRLYFASLVGNYQQRPVDKRVQEYPYLRLAFSNKEDIRALSCKLRRPLSVPGIGVLNLKIHEQDASPMLQFVCLRDIPISGWIKFDGKLVEPALRKTSCDKEYIVKWESVRAVLKDDPLFTVVPRPLIMAMDIETNALTQKAEAPCNKVFQISCVVARHGCPQSEYVKYLLTLGEPDDKIVGDDVSLFMYETEGDLLEGYKDLINEVNPNVIVGYNILGYDINYMIIRAKHAQCIYEFDQQGFLKNAHAREKSITWSSAAYKNQEFKYLDAEGRLFVDLLPLVQRDFKLENYKLDTVAMHFIGSSKDDLDLAGILNAYKVGMAGCVKNASAEKKAAGSKELGVCGKYCVQDSVLVIRLMEKLQTWIGLCEMAKTCNVQMFSLYTAGQQIKVYSQVYKYCMYNNVVVESNGYAAKADDHYVGATVLDPIPGVYDRVVSLDFASLYPSLIIAYNIDYSTLVADTDEFGRPKIDQTVDDSDCNVMNFEDHVGCIHDPKVVRRNALTELIHFHDDKIKVIREKKTKSMDSFRKKEYDDAIKKIADEIQPYKDERSNLAKSKPKHVMCAKRNFRFLKNTVVKGVLPSVISGLLEARKNTRNEMKDLEKRLKNPDAKLSHQEKNELEVLISVLNQRQLSYKVSANSMYGAMGVEKGYLPFMPGAMATTFMGRTAIKTVTEVIPAKYGGKLIYGDTDTCLPDTPVLVKIGTEIQYRTMEELSDGNWALTITGKEMSKAQSGLMVWSDIGFTPITYVIRHAITKPLIRVVTHIGSVECTLDHSLLWDNGNPAKASQVSVGSRLLTAEFPLPNDTPDKPIYANHLTEQCIVDYVIPNTSSEVNGVEMPADLAFAWGMFYAEGSCRNYQTPSTTRASWAISGQDNILLERCAVIFSRYEPLLDFRILDMMKSSNANKLVPKCKIQKHGTIVEFVNRYRSLFYDRRCNKRVPAVILNSCFDVRQAFFMGYWAGDGSKKDPAISLSNKGAIGSAGLFYLMRSIGYQVSMNVRADKPTIYKLTGSTPEKKTRYPKNAVKKIHPTKIHGNLKPLNGHDGYVEQPEYIYDIETVNHHFAAGVGQLIVHNSNYLAFPGLEKPEEIWDKAVYVADEVTKLFPKPMKIEFENCIYWRYLILTKKRYMSLSCGRDGVLEKVKDKSGKPTGANKISKKGVLLTRRDNSTFVRNVYEKVINMIFDRADPKVIMEYIIEQLNMLCSNSFGYKNFVITKAIGSTGDLIPVPCVNKTGQPKTKIGDYMVTNLAFDPEERKKQFILKGCTDAIDPVKEYYIRSLPAQVQLAERMRARGVRVDVGTRLEYVITDHGGVKAKQYTKIESADYFKKHRRVLKIDVMYYMNALANPLDQVLNIAFNGATSGELKGKIPKDFVYNQYMYRLRARGAVMKELKKRFEPVLVFEGEDDEANSMTSGRGRAKPEPAVMANLVFEDETVEAVEYDAENEKPKRLRPMRNCVAVAPVVANYFVACLDTETTGVNHNTDKLIEVALKLLEVSPDHRVIREVDSYESLHCSGVNILNSYIHGITDKMVAGHYVDKQRVYKMMAKAKFIVAHNASFDQRFMKQIVPYETFEWKCTYKGINWASLYPLPSGPKQGPNKVFNVELPNYKLDTLATTLGLETGVAHRAMGDVITLVSLLKADIKGKTGLQWLMESRS